ncbi:hypothetical protein EfmAA242_03580 [Enterococcus faecium]|nr:hypothetical protein EfmAA242_03580 [Enterococcus faecium]
MDKNIRKPKNQIVQMKKLTQKIETSFREGTQEHVQLDIDFHTMIAEASGNVFSFFA